MSSGCLPRPHAATTTPDACGGHWKQDLVIHCIRWCMPCSRQRQEVQSFAVRAIRTQSASLASSDWTSIPCSLHALDQRESPCDQRADMNMNMETQDACMKCLLPLFSCPVLFCLPDCAEQQDVLYFECVVFDPPVMPVAWSFMSLMSPSLPVSHVIRSRVSLDWKRTCTHSLLIDKGNGTQRVFVSTMTLSSRQHLPCFL